MLRSMGHFLPRRYPHKRNDLLITQKMELETGNALGCKNEMLQYNTLEVGGGCARLHADGVFVLPLHTVLAQCEYTFLH